MASSSAMPAGNSANGLTAAERLLAQHTADDTHQPSVEEVVDESDLARPSTLVSTPGIADQSTSATNGSAPSAKAAGKQKVSADSRPIVTKPKGPAIDTSSEAAFPSLAAPKTKPTNAPSSAWGSKPPSAAVSNGNSSMSNAPISGAASKTSMPSIRAGSSSMPGSRYQEAMPIAISQLKTRAELGKSIPDILRVANSRAKAQVSMAQAGPKQLMFTAQGPSVDSVQEALKNVIAQIGAKLSVKVPIPASVKKHLIGKGGATIQAISKKSGARVNVPKSDPSQELDEDATILVEVEGDPITAEIARREIEAIAKANAASVNLRLRDIPPEFYPFLAGPHNSRISALEGERDVRVKVPYYHTWDRQPPAMQPGAFTPHDALHIQLSGERDTARDVQAEIERQVARLRQILTVMQVDGIQRERHQFVVGDRGSSLHDFLEETGCSVILPPASDETDAIIIIGPADRLEAAENKVMDLASSMSMDTVDITRQFPQTPQHALDVSRYLQHRQALEEFEQLYDASIASPVEAADGNAWKIYARDGKNTMRARADLLKMVGAHPPSRFRKVDVHPYYQQLLKEQHAQAVREQTGVHLMFPATQSADGQLVLVYEGQGPAAEYAVPRTKPSNNEVTEFENALAEAEKHILTLIGDSSDVVDHKVEAPAKFRQKIERFGQRHRENNPNNAVQFTTSRSGGTANGNSKYPVEFRGPSSNVEAFRQSLLDFIEEQIHDEAERDYTTTCAFPQKFANVLIGKRGENINKLRDEYDVEIQVQDGEVKVQGPQKKADAARAHIISLAKKLEDETTHVIKIKPSFHGDLIGSKGSQVTRLQDRYKVRINFPRTSTSPDTQSLADGASEVGGPPKPRRPNQALDEVTIRGPKRGADEARDELLGLYQYSQDNSHTATVSVPQALLPSLIGTGGRELDKLRLETGASIDIPGSREMVDPSGRVEIKLRGTKANVDSARKTLQGRARGFDESVQKTLKVENKHHAALIGREGSKIQQMVLEAGGSSEPGERKRLIQFPRGEDVIHLEGRQEIIEKLASAIETFVTLREQQTTDTVSIAPERHGALIGKGGETRKAIETDHNVTMQIPSTSVTGPERAMIRLTGMPEDVAKAKERILGMVKGPEEETIEMPMHFHHVIADGNNGNFFRSLSRDLRVKVDHAGRAKPPRPARYVPKAAANLPLITDSVSDSAMLDPEEHHSWEVVSGVPETDGSEDTIPWVIKGSDASNVAKAKALIEAAMASAQEACIGYLVLPDPSMARYVIGPGGSTVNAIRQETSCSINVPKIGGGSGGIEAIEVKGPRDGVLMARQMIIEAVTNGVQSRR